jgi:hypothetical protein
VTALTLANPTVIVGFPNFAHINQGKAPDVFQGQGARHRLTAVPVVSNTEPSLFEYLRFFRFLQEKRNQYRAL